MVTEYLIGNLHDKPIECHLLTANTSTAAKTVWAIEDCLVIRGSNCPTCKAVGENGERGQLAKLTAALTTQTDTLSTQSEMLSTQSRVLAEQSKAMGRVMVRLEALVRVSV